jgi:hypothetical protein
MLWMLRDLAARFLPRKLAVALGIRHLTPWGIDWPNASVDVAPIDTGGGFRAAYRMQDPSKDPREPGGGESSSAGENHGWSNCTMASGAMGLAYQNPRGSKAPWGGDLRHRQGDQSGGTDLYDVKEAWASYGETLTIKTGGGWSAVKKYHDEGRALVVQGEGNVPGSESFDGGHGCIIAPETHSDGRWLFGDPLATGWQWVSQGSIRTWMEALSSGCYFAIGEKPEGTPVPPTEPPDTGGTPTPDRYPIGYADGHASGVIDGQAIALDAVFLSWQSVDAPPPFDGSAWGDAVWDTTIAYGDVWEAVPIPITWLRAAQVPATWADSGWTASLWEGA